jgi:uncharacterized protein (DUF2062 family)
MRLRISKATGMFPLLLGNAVFSASIQWLFDLFMYVVIWDKTYYLGPIGGSPSTVLNFLELLSGMHILNIYGPISSIITICELYIFNVLLFALFFEKKDTTKQA